MNGVKIEGGAKYKKLGGFGYYSYTKLFHSCVTPILDYCSGIWGYKTYGKIDTVHNRALKIFLGVHAFAPNAAINADMGWSSSNCRRKVEMLRLWNRLVNMDVHRLTKHIFEWDYNINRNSWSSDIKKVLTEIDCTDKFYLKISVNINLAF